MVMKEIKNSSRRGKFSQNLFKKLNITSNFGNYIINV